jgi:hypothetical protein
VTFFYIIIKLGDNNFFFNFRLGWIFLLKHIWFCFSKMLWKIFEFFLYFFLFQINIFRCFCIIFKKIILRLGLVAQPYPISLGLAVQPHSWLYNQTQPARLKAIGSGSVAKRKAMSSGFAARSKSIGSGSAARFKAIESCPTARSRKIQEYWVWLDHRSNSIQSCYLTRVITLKITLHILFYI